MKSWDYIVVKRHSVEAQLLAWHGVNLRSLKVERWGRVERGLRYYHYPLAWKILAGAMGKICEGVVAKHGSKDCHTLPPDQKLFLQYARQFLDEWYREESGEEEPPTRVARDLSSDAVQRLSALLKRRKPWVPDIDADQVSRQLIDEDVVVTHGLESIHEVLARADVSLNLHESAHKAVSSVFREIFRACARKDEDSSIRQLET